MDDLLKDAIADAKAVRETALANAKMALEEAFTPKLKSMLAQKIQQEIDDDEVEDMHDDDVEMEPEEEGYSVEGDDDMEDEIEEVEGDEDHEDEIAEEEGDEDHEDEIAEEEGDEDHEDEIAEEEGDEDEPVDEADELDLEAILRELEEEADEDGEDEEEPVDENDVSSDIGKADNKVNAKANDSSETGAQGPEGEGSDEESGKELDDHEVVKEEEDNEKEVDEEIDLEEVLKALQEEDEEDDQKDEVANLKSEIKEHRDVVKYLRAKLNEVNLLNAKLLFSNKLFRSYGLSNEQKMKVVETFDRAKNLREIKLVYTTLAESFGNNKPATVNESVKKGSSSKAVASTKPKKEVISEGEELKNRFKKLANII